MDFTNLFDENSKSPAPAPAPTPRDESSATVAADPLYNVVADEKKEVTELDGTRKLKQDTVSQTCPSCGAPMVFDPESAGLKCPYCSTKRAIAATGAEEIGLTFGEDTARSWSEETRVFHCQTCGAETVLDRAEFATQCAFCGSPYVVSREDIEGIRPSAVVPFAFGKDKAGEHYKKWIKSRFYAPKAFKNLAAEKFSGVYSPSWTFDSVTRSTYNGVVGDYYYVTVGSGKNRHTERRIRWRSVSGSWARDFNDVLVPSGQKIDAASLAKIAPFPTENAVSYDPSFLAGYSAEHYSVDLEQGWQVAKDDMYDTVRGEIKRSLHCDVVQSLNVNTQFLANTFKYTMLPVYVTHCKYKKKDYTFFVNGTTGRTHGKHPISAGKVLLTVFGALLVIGAIVLAVCLSQ